MGSGNGKDKAEERAALARRLSQLPARKRLEALLDAPNAKALVRSTPAEDLYFAIADVGLADATELVQLASPKQFQTFVDLGGWKRDRMEPHQVLTWLRAARGDDPTEFLAKLQGLDLEVVEVLLRAFTVIHDLEETPDVNPDGVTVETPEGRYLVELKAEGPELSALRALVNDLLSQNPLESVRMLEAVRWELPSELEETAYRFRTARLEDLGFPDAASAAALFSYVDPASVERPKARVVERQTAALAPSERPDFLEAALNGLNPQEREALEGELRYLINAALVAEAADPGDLDAVRALSERARDYLLLGMEYLTGGDPAAAPELVRATPSRRIFQVGFSLTLKLKFRADRLLKSPVARAGGVTWAVGHDALAFEAVRRKRPLRALKVEGAEPVPFRSLRELAQAEAMLGRVEHQLTLFRALLGPTLEAAQARLQGVARPEGPAEPERVLAAAVCQAVLEGTLVAAPVPQGRLLELAGRLLEGTAEAPKLRASAVQRVHGALANAALGPAEAEARRVADEVLERLCRELGPPFLGAGALGPEVAEVLPVAGL